MNSARQIIRYGNSGTGQLVDTYPSKREAEAKSAELESRGALAPILKFYEEWCVYDCGLRRRHKPRPTDKVGNGLSKDGTNRGRYVKSEEQRQKIAETLQGRQLPRSVVDKVAAANKGREPWNKGGTLSEETKHKMSVVRKGKIRSREHCENLSKAMKKWWANPDNEEKITKIIRGMGAVRHGYLHAQPTKPERILGSVLKEHFPNEYKYTGNNADFIINRMIPDFININGQKKVIELFGTYWHSEEIRGMPPEEEEEIRKRRFKECGFGCLIVWEDEVKEDNREVRRKLVGKLKEFHKS